MHIILEKQKQMSILFIFSDGSVIEFSDWHPEATQQCWIKKAIWTGFSSFFMIFQCFAGPFFVAWLKNYNWQKYVQIVRHLYFYYSEMDWRSRCSRLHNHTFYKAKSKFHTERPAERRHLSVHNKFIIKKRSSESQLPLTYISL